jgi:uncharacterized membrane protein YfcA
MRDLLAFVGVCVGGAIAAGGGLGGGGVVVPILILIGGFDTRNAVPLSNAFLFGVGILNVGQLAVKRHPNADRPVIDYWLSFVMIPPKLAGTVFGGECGVRSFVFNWKLSLLR